MKCSVKRTGGEERDRHHKLLFLFPFSLVGEDCIGWWTLIEERRSERLALLIFYFIGFSHRVRWQNSWASSSVELATVPATGTNQATFTSPLTDQHVNIRTRSISIVFLFQSFSFKLITLCWRACAFRLSRLFWPAAFTSGLNFLVDWRHHFFSLHRVHSLLDK